MRKLGLGMSLGRLRLFRGGAASAQQGIFGTQLTNGSGNWGTNPNRAMLDRFTLTHTATVKRLKMLILAGSLGGVNMKGVICADNAGAPGTVLSVGAPVAIGAGGPFYVTSVMPNTVLAPGDYWIGGVADASGAEFGSGAHTAPNAVIINGDFSYATPPATCPAPAANYMNDVGCYIEYDY